jgi:hypothetical protein
VLRRWFPTSRTCLARRRPQVVPRWHRRQQRRRPPLGQMGTTLRLRLRLRPLRPHKVPPHWGLTRSRRVLRPWLTPRAPAPAPALVPMSTWVWTRRPRRGSPARRLGLRAKGQVPRRGLGQGLHQVGAQLRPRPALPHTRGRGRRRPKHRGRRRGRAHGRTLWQPRPSPSALLGPRPRPWCWSPPLPRPWWGVPWCRPRGSWWAWLSQVRIVRLGSPGCSMCCLSVTPALGLCCWA